MVRCAEGEEQGEAAFMDQRAVAGGKKYFDVTPGGPSPRECKLHQDR